MTQTPKITLTRKAAHWLIRLALRAAPTSREDWARAMSAELDVIESHREALWWALGCLKSNCLDRLAQTRSIDFGPVRWGMALWIALLAADTLAYAYATLGTRLGIPRGQLALAPNFPLQPDTPLWDPLLSLAAGIAFSVSAVLILRRSRIALPMLVPPVSMTLLLFVLRLCRPGNGYLDSLLTAISRSPVALVGPVAGLLLTACICRGLWCDRQLTRRA